MITDKEINISNKSYINKDFASIYPELLEKAKELSTKYDPEASNESDPFIVLLKLLAFVGDKLNYNIDKNVLERFMPSATQDTSMRELCEMMGYNVQYYIAPVVDVVITYDGDADFSGGKSFTLPKLKTVVTNNDGNIEYVLTRDYTILAKNDYNAQPVEAIQGTVRTLSVFDSDVVQLENLDENNRVYFPEITVAQNGVFIEGGIGSQWTRVDNLNIQENMSTVYKFGFDSGRGLPYLEFPDDINLLIGDGLTIKYILTSGANGNVGKKQLTLVSTPQEVYWDGSTSEDDKVSFEVKEGEKPLLNVLNSSSSYGGASPQTIEEAYNGFKKTIGTFDTLVTPRDYANKIYSLLDSNGLYPLVSNVQVGDRRVDINYSNDIYTYGQYGPEIIHEPIIASNSSWKIVGTQPSDWATTYQCYYIRSDEEPYTYTLNSSSTWDDSNTYCVFVTEESEINANDLCIYALNPIKSYSVDTFKSSFQPLEDKYPIEQQLEYDGSKCISHNYKELKDDDIYAIKNYYKLEARISTTYKVSKLERASILANVYNALIEKFNARKVDFGYEIPYDELLQVIESSDERIKSVSLYEPELDTRFMTADGSEYPIDTDEGVESFVTVLAKDILSGHIEMFSYDDRFDYDYGQDSTQVFGNVSKISTEANVEIQTSGYEVQENEAVQFVTPSLITKVTYPYGINYYLQLNSPNNYIPANTEYELQSGECCIFEYTNSSNQQVVHIYQHSQEKPTIIKPNVNLYTTAYRMGAHAQYSHGETPIIKTIANISVVNEIEAIDTDILDNENQIKLYTLSTNDQVEYRTINIENTSNGIQYVYWMVNNIDNEIEWETIDTDTYQYMLKDGEYFFRTDGNMGVLYSYGSGTVLTRTGLDTLEEGVEEVDMGVVEDGLLRHPEYFKTITVDVNNTLTFLEQQILTLAKGDSVGGTHISTTNDFVTLTSSQINSLWYKFEGDEGTSSLTPVPYTGGYWKVRSILDLNVGPDQAQTIVGQQQVTLTIVDAQGQFDHDEVLSTNTSFYTVNPHQVGGGEIDVRSRDIYDEEKIIYEAAYDFVPNSQTSAKNRNVLGYDEQVVSVPIGETKTFNYTVPSIKNESNTYNDVLLMLYIRNIGNTKPQLLLSTTQGQGGASSTIRLYTGVSSGNTLFIDGAEGVYPIVINKNTLDPDDSLALHIQFQTGGYSGAFALSKPRIVEGINSRFGFDALAESENNTYSASDMETMLKNKIKSLDVNNRFMYCNFIDNSKSILVEDVSSPYAFYDYNNISQKWTISEIDFSEGSTDIDVARSSWA